MACAFLYILKFLSFFKKSKDNNKTLKIEIIKLNNNKSKFNQKNSKIFYKQTLPSIYEED